MSPKALDSERPTDSLVPPPPDAAAPTTPPPCVEARGLPAPVRQLSWPREVHVRHLQSRIVSQGVVCVHSACLGSPLLFRGCFCANSRGTALYAFCVYHSSNRHMTGVHF
jgi:hypothetical protein